jgi:hypothetical protein
MKNIALTTLLAILFIGCGSGSTTSNNLDNPKSDDKETQKSDNHQNTTEKLYDLTSGIKKAENEDNSVGYTKDLFLERGLVEVLLLGDKYQHDKLFQRDENGNIINNEYFYEGEVDNTKEGENIIFYYLKDSNGNKRGFNKHIFVVKNTPPKIELIGDSKIKLKVGEIFTIPYVNVFDREDRSHIEDLVEISGVVDIYQPGSYKITYSVIDSGGLKSEVSRVVEVIGRDDMQISAKNDDNSTDIYLLDYLKTEVDHDVEIFNKREFISKLHRDSYIYGSTIGDDKIVLSEKDGYIDLSFYDHNLNDTINNIKISYNVNVGDRVTDSCSLDAHYESINIMNKNYNDVIKIVCKNRSEGFYQKDFGLIVQNILLPRTGKELSLNTNDYIGRDMMNIDALYGPKYNLSGKGVKVGIVDGGFVLDTHQELKNRVTIMSRDGYELKYESHPTHVAGIIGASGINSDAIGVATASKLYSYSFNQYINSDGNYFDDMDKNGIFLSNHSYGPEIDSIYNYFSQNTDNFISNHPYNIAVVSSGNSRGGVDNYWSIRDFASAKNVITVGAVDKDRNITFFSSTGPVNSGRIKPDLVSFGKSVISSDKGNDKDYVYMSGTSMSSPHITGLLALLEEEYQKVNGELMREDSAKAILVNSATDLGRVGPDYEYGYGIPDALKAVKIIDSMARHDSLVIEDEVKEHKQKEYSLYLAEDSDVKITLCWIDPSGESEYIDDDITPTINSNLEIKIVDKDGKIYYPWSLNDDYPTDPARDDKPNSVDNVKQIEAHLKKGRYRVVITNKIMNIGIKQNFSLVSSNPLGGTALTKEQMSKSEFEFFMMNMI